MDITYNIQNFKQNLPDTCVLVAVSKTQPVEVILQAYESGQKDFGENKVQELLSKAEALPADIRWHMIGHLQTNKVKYIVPFVHLIHSVDSLKLLNEINKQGKKLGRIISCLLQVHIAREESKFGFLEEDLWHHVNGNEFKKLTHIKIEGLMGMATFTQNTELVRAEFKTLKGLFDKLKSESGDLRDMKILSMGMSDDYAIALEEGSTMIRVGSALFGKRIVHG